MVNEHSNGRPVGLVSQVSDRQAGQSRLPLLKPNQRPASVIGALRVSRLSKLPQGASLKQRPRSRNSGIDPAWPSSAVVVPHARCRAGDAGNGAEIFVNGPQLVLLHVP